MLPGLVERFEKLCHETGLGGEEIIIRSTGCPNGCARPYMAEIAFVGKAPGRYQVWLGADAAGTRLNQIWKDVMKETDIETEFRPVLKRFAQERQAGERFGDWCHRVFLKEQPATVKAAN
jgi:sulfite reductase (NADPH) hemoprotein beta-component